MRHAILIESQPDFQQLLRKLAESTHVAIDTESNSFYAYFERVCLIQISVEEGDFVLDPLAIDDVRPLGEILENEGIEKIFHAASNDLIGIKRLLGTSDIPDERASTLRTDNLFFQHGLPFKRHLFRLGGGG